MAVYQYRYSKLEIYDVKLNEFLNTNRSTDTKTLWKYLEIGRKLAVDKAREQVGVKTGALRKNISSYHLGNFTGQYVGLRSTLPYSYIHHQGSKKHIIEPRGTNQLIFRGRSGVIATYHVNHPGTKPNRFLKDQMRGFGKVRFGR
jgi:hypothetical protein